jgi:PKD repeat protein
MIKPVFLSVVLSFCFFVGNAQISVPGDPESFSVKTKSTVVIPSKVLDAIDTSKYLEEDRKTGVPNRYGVVQQMDIDIKTEGVKTEISGKGYIWQYEINSVQAYSLGINFGKYRLPVGASVFIYDESHSNLLGSFTSKNNNSRNQLTIADLTGENAIIEYFEPLNPSFSGQLSISSVSQAYKDALKEESTSTRIGINCTVGADWQDAKHAVCRMTFRDGSYSYLCTGFLINNVNEDGTPYFETANHCISTSTEAATLVTYFNYEDSTCTSSDASKKQTLSGATLKATNSYSDFTLLLLDEYPPTSYVPYYAGWDVSSRSPQTGTCIHHPAGDVKCIALDYSAPTSYGQSIQWTDDNDNVVSTTAANTHWKVVFSVGATEGGSSGSPLFDDNQRVIGQLHGGSDTYDLFGKLSLSWNHSSSSSAQLKYWLDPDTTGTLSLDGAYNNVKPKAYFSTSLTKICVGSTITLADSSKYNPTSWNWDIQPSTFEFTDGTSSSSENPEVIFNSAGNYTITLIVQNTNGGDTLTKTDYITAGDISVKLSGITTDSIVCGCDLIKYPLTASGATSYSFSVERSDKITYTIDSENIYLSLISTEKKNGSFNSLIKVVGTQGSCTSSDSIEMKVSMPVNDDIANAVRLWPGRNTAYSNFCGSVETDEAAPSSVTLKNTIWFKFQGPSDGKITIDTHGFNDQIAVYEASSDSDLISGSTSSYTLLENNDDRSTSDNTALISDLSVDPYKMYWLQVDGSDGATGSVVIDLLSNSIDVYPNPSTGEFNVIISNNDDGNAEVKIVSLLGQVIVSNVLAVTKESNSFVFDLSSYPSGMYIMIVKINGSTLKTKLSLIK